MRINVEILGVPMLLDVLGKKSFPLEIDGSGPRELLDALVRLGGEHVKKALFTPEGDFDNAIQVALNGEEFISVEDETVQFRDGDRVIFMMLIGGG